MIFRMPWVLIAIPVFLFMFIVLRRMRREPGFLFPTDEVIKTFKGSLKLWLVSKVVYLRIACILLVILALARPQVTREARVKKEGIAIVLAVDCSSTMLEGDLRLRFDELAKNGDVSSKDRKVKRIDAVREVAKDFIKSRPDDLIGIVAFAAEAYVVCPLTFDHKWLLQSLKRVKVGLIKDGTAVGSGILSSLNSLRDVKAKSKVIVLLTDGINNFGRIPPLVAAKAARALGIKIYTVGVVSKGSGLYMAEDGSGRRVYKEVKIDVDEDELRKIARLTGGEYFRATDMKTLRDSYKEIDRLEKVGIEEKGYEEYVDVFMYFLFLALLLLLLEILLSNTFLRRIP